MFNGRVRALTVDRAIVEYRGLQPHLYTFLDRIEFRQIAAPDDVVELVVTVTLSSKMKDLVELVFHGVRDLTIDWPPLTKLHIGPLEIADISDRDWEDIRYKVTEPEGLLSFTCRYITLWRPDSQTEPA